MPKIRFGPDTLEVPEGTNLRKALLDAGLALYNPPLSFANCMGFGTCGTCAVKVEGPVSARTSMEKFRLGVPPHRHDNGLRLACQCKVEGDLNVVKYPGKWGEQVSKPPRIGTPGAAPSEAPSPTANS